MPFGFDPRKLVDDEKKLKKEEVVEAVNKLRRRSRKR